MNHEVHSDLFDFSTLFTTYPKIDSWRAFTPVGHLRSFDLFKPTEKTGKMGYRASLSLDNRIVTADEDWIAIGHALRHYGYLHLASANMQPKSGRILFPVRSIKRATDFPRLTLLPNYDREHTTILTCASEVNYPPIVVDQNGRPITHFDSRIIHAGCRARFLIGMRFAKDIPSVMLGYCTFNLHQVQIFLNEHTSSDFTTRALRLP